MAYTYDALFAVDPQNPSNVAKNATITIFDPADPTQAAISITDPTGSPLPNPITVDAAGMGPAFQHPTLARVGWKGAGFTGYFTSYEGMFNETVAAKAAAQAAVSAAATAGADAAAVASSALAGAVANAAAAAAAAANSAALVGAPVDTAIQQAITSPGSATRAALNDTIATATTPKLDKVEAASTYAAQNDLLDTAAVQRAALSKFPRVLALAVGRRGTTYDLFQKVAAGKWWRTALEVGSSGVHQIKSQHLILADAVADLVVASAPPTYVEETDASVAYAGTWSTPQSSIAGTQGGTYKYSNTAASTATWTTPTGVKTVGVNQVRTTNGALTGVSIDGDKTRATKLPTAQELVTAGTYPNTILVANGGTLNPTDRVLDGYAGSLSASVDVTLADDLTAGIHTVVLTATTYARTGITATRTYLSAFFHGTSTAPAVISTAASAWEYAYQTQPDGTATKEYSGMVHNYETETGFTVAVDGATVNLADGQVLAVNKSAVITRTTTLTHVDLAGAKLADVVTVLTLTRDGIDCDVDTTWSRGANVHFAYAMMPLPGIDSGASGFSKGDLLAWGGGPFTIPDSETTYYLGTSESVAAWLWQPSGNLAAAMWSRNAREFTKNWQGSIKTSIENRTGGLSKVYHARISSTGSPERVENGTVWKSRVRYVFAYLPDVTVLG